MIPHLREKQNYKVESVLIAASVLILAGSAFSGGASGSVRYMHNCIAPEFIIAARRKKKAHDAFWSGGCLKKE